MDWRERSYPRIVLVGLAAALAVTLVVAAGTSSASLGAFNPAWDGTTELRTAAESSGAETTVARNVSAYDRTAPNETIAVVLSPATAYNGSETAAVERFVRDGGTLLVAEDYRPHGNELLDAVGAQARVTGVPLRDERNAGPSPAFPRTEPVGTHPLTTGVEELMLNHGTTVEPGNATTLVESSAYSYLDRNRNEELDDEESLARRPVLTVESVGEGRVAVLSDPSVFLNAMAERGDNAAFTRAVVTSHEAVLLDVSHSPALPPLVTLRLALEGSGVALFLAGTLSVLAVVVLAEPSGLVGRLRERPSVPDRAPERSRESPSDRGTDTLMSGDGKDQGNE